MKPDPDEASAPAADVIRLSPNEKPLAIVPGDRAYQRQKLVILATAAIVILYPLIRWYGISRDISAYDRRIAQARDTNRVRIQQLGTLQETKIQTLIECSKHLSILDARLDRNIKLREQTEETQKKWESVKALLDEQRDLERKIYDFKAALPEFFKK